MYPQLYERVMGLEPTISCLGSKRSTTELHPLDELLGLYDSLKTYVKENE